MSLRAPLGRRDRLTTVASPSLGPARAVHPVRARPAHTRSASGVPVPRSVRERVLVAEQTGHHVPIVQPTSRGG